MFFEGINVSLKGRSRKWWMCPKFNIVKPSRLLSQTTLPVSGIAERVGYSNSSYFSTRFKKKIIGQNPREYRAKNR